MKTFLDCIPCFVRQALDSARLATDDEKNHEQVVRETLRLTADLDKNIFFILKAKCPVIARDLGCKVGEMILQKSNSFKSVDNLIKEAE